MSSNVHTGSESVNSIVIGVVLNITISNSIYYIRFDVSLNHTYTVHNYMVQLRNYANATLLSNELVKLVVLYRTIEHRYD